MELSLELRLILAILTTYRLARLIARDDGPFFIFKRIRYWVKDKAWHEAGEPMPFDDDTMNDRYFGNWYSLSEGLSCPYCLGVWFSLPLLALLVWPSYYGDLFLLLMAISGAQAFLWGVVSK